MFEGIVNKPNHVSERQKLYQSSHAPLYVRGPRSKLYLSVYLVGFSVGMIGVVTGVASLIKGKPSA